MFSKVDAELNKVFRCKAQNDESAFETKCSSKGALTKTKDCPEDITASHGFTNVSILTKLAIST
jgi:hypothetical protein